MTFPALGAGLSPPTAHTPPRLLNRRSKTPQLSIPEMKSSQKFRVLIAANGARDVAQAEALAIRFSNHPHIETRSIVDTMTQRMTRTVSTWKNVHTGQADDGDEMVLRDAYEMCEWADILVLAPIDANTMAKMLNGMTGTLMLEVLRGWDVSKKIIMIPGMTSLMWENPMTRKQLFEVRTKWNWVRVMSPILWSYESSTIRKVVAGWTAFGELVEVIQNQADLMTIGHDVDNATSGAASRRSQKTDTMLPPEIWTLIFQYVGDWEVAMRMRVWTNLPTPEEWKKGNAPDKDPLQQYLRSLEWTILLQPTSRIIAKLAEAPPNLAFLTSLSVKLVIKFGLTPVLSYLENNLKDVFWSSFGSKLLPTKASAVYGRPDVLEWWRTSPSFLKKDYTVEAIDGASKSGFVHVLDWWQKSGLPLKYSEVALEGATSKGHILVLEWWREASMHQDSHSTDSVPITPVSATDGTTPKAPLRLKVGKSIVAAAQNGRVAALTWWDTSRIPYSHSESVCKIASAYGHVPILREWKRLKGDKFAMSFDNQVLVGSTKNGFVKVLEWWKEQTLGGVSPVTTVEGDERRGSDVVAGGMTAGRGGKGRLRVEYKTCDIEEALEDSVGGGGDGEVEVRKWWAKNGLNLGVGTSEWMQIKTL